VSCGSSSYHSASAAARSWVKSSSSDSSSSSYSKKEKLHCVNVDQCTVILFQAAQKTRDYNVAIRQRNARMRMNLAKAAFAHAKATLEKTLALSLKVVKQEIKVAQNAVDRAHWQKLQVESKGVTDDLLDTFAGAGIAVSRDLGNFKSLAKILAASAEGVKDWAPGHNKKAMQAKLKAIAHSKYLQKAIIT